MNFASDHQPSPHHPPLVPCAGDEGTPSPNHKKHLNNVKNSKSGYPRRHGSRGTRPAPTSPTDTLTIKKAIVSI